MRAIIVASVLCVGCATPPPGYNYVLTVDKNFSQEYVSAIIDAASNWQSMVGEKLNITYNFTGVCQGDGDEICIHASSHAAIVAMAGNDGEIGITVSYWPSGHHDIYIPTKEDANETLTVRSMVIGHELGHAFGLEHITPGNLMCWAEGCASPTPTCSDIAQFVSARRGYVGFSEWRNDACPQGGSFALSGK